MSAGTTTGAEPSAAPPRRHHWFITGLGIGQIVSWGSFYYSFPLIAEPMGQELGLTKPEVYGAATFGLAVAGIAAYPIGAFIDKGGGRAVMAVGSAIGGLLLIGWSQVDGLLSFYPLFAGIGLIQAMTLYEPAFAVVVRRYGAQARGGITALTLWGGFASTVFVPLVQVLLDTLGWRDALIALGLINLVLCVALYFFTIDPRADVAPPAPESAVAPRTGHEAVRWVMTQPAFWGLAVCFTVFAGMHSALIFHLYPMLIERGYDTATTVAAIAIFGPSQVAGRIAIWLFAGRRSIRIIGMVHVVLFPLALMVLLTGSLSFAVAALFAVIYGAANGIMTIVRGLAVPEMLTRDAYGAINGALATPMIVVRAAAPFAAALLWQWTGSYHAVLIAALIASGLVVASFWFAALMGQTTPARPSKSR